MDNRLIAFNKALRRTDLPDLRAGDVVRIHRKIKEGGKERIQMFEGMVIAVKAGQSAAPSITVRKVSFGIGVEIVFPLHSPQVEKIELVKRTRARRAKLYYVRDKSAKVLSKKLKEVNLKMIGIEDVPATEEAPAPEPMAEQESAEAARSKQE